MRPPERKTVGRLCLDSPTVTSHVLGVINNRRVPMPLSSVFLYQVIKCVRGHRAFKTTMHRLPFPCLLIHYKAKSPAPPQSPPRGAAIYCFTVLGSEGRKQLSDIVSGDMNNNVVSGFVNSDFCMCARITLFLWCLQSYIGKQTYIQSSVIGT